MTTGFDSADIDQGASASPDMAEPLHGGGSSGSTRARVAGAAEVVGLYAVCIVAALLLSVLLVETTGGDAGAVFSALLDGSIRGPGGSAPRSEWPCRCSSLRSAPSCRPAPG